MLDVRNLRTYFRTEAGDAKAVDGLFDRCREDSSHRWREWLRKDRHGAFDPAAVAVMYLGKIVEQEPTEELYGNPRHPYTQVLLSAIPVPNPRLRKGHLKSTDTDDSVPSPINIPSGCPFHPRCPLYAAKGKPAECRTQLPELLPLKSNPKHVARCHFAEVDS